MLLHVGAANIDAMTQTAGSKFNPILEGNWRPVRKQCRSGRTGLQRLSDRALPDPELFARSRRVVFAAAVVRGLMRRQIWE